MPKPLIGLTTGRMPDPLGGPACGTNLSYIQSIFGAGGIPILISPELPNEDADPLLSRLDGILFTGGWDIDPGQYGSLPHPKVKGIDGDRDRMEIQLARRAIQSGKPFLGVCRGIQLMNVAQGGSLYQDLAEQLQGEIRHDNHNRPRDYLAHDVKLEPGSQLASILGSGEILVNSLHHQGIHTLAEGFEPTGYAQDGLIEAIELPDHPFGLAVQWHPEELQEHEAMRRLFQVFIESCKPAYKHNR